LLEDAKRTQSSILEVPAVENIVMVVQQFRSGKNSKNANK